jgi:hypothetical protein
MREIKVTVPVEIDLEDIRIGCSAASSYCFRALQCEDCPFRTSSHSVDEIICMYTDLLAKEVNSEVNNAAD